MKIGNIVSLMHNDTFFRSEEFQRIIKDIKKVLKSIEHPKDSGGFFLLDQRPINETTPIVKVLREKLILLGWGKERRIKDPLDYPKIKMDASLQLESGKFFGVEFLAGNISFAHRSVNRMKKGISDGVLEGAILIIPSKTMSSYLPDGVANYQEIEPYIEVMKDNTFEGTIIILEIEQDGLKHDIEAEKK